MTSTAARQKASTLPLAYRTIVRSQFSATLAMLEQCINQCPDGHWDDVIAKYPFWHVVYHTLCFVDCYLSPSNDAFVALVESRAAQPFNPQPLGMAELNEEFPSRRFSRAEMIQYAAYCRGKMDRVLTSETDADLNGPSGFDWLKFSRGELHLYNVRHVQHHTGQLSAALRRAGVETRWVKSA